MAKEQDRLKKELILKEEQLLKDSVRNDAGKIAELLDENCIEYTASGKRVKYKPGELFGDVEGEWYIDSATVQMVDLSDDCKLLLYVAGKVSKNTRVKSNRSSVWKKVQGKWKILFHQGTNCAD